MLEPGWVHANHRLFDVFHVHFGFDAIGPDVLTSVVEELAEHGKPLVYTMHDLRNPHQADPRPHGHLQDILVGAASELITLTPGAAQEVWRRWGRKCRVLPHPHVLERDRIVRPRQPGSEFVVGVHAKSLRANMDPLPVLDALVDIMSALPQAILQIDLHDEIFDPGNHWFAPDAGRALLDFGRHEHVRVAAHAYFSDSQFWDYLSSLTVSLLPYRFGTHSGWLEACYDLGTAVIVPTCGFYHEQRPCGVFEFTEDQFCVESLRLAVEDAYRHWAAGVPPPRADWSDRFSERAALADAHRSLYESAVQSAPCSGSR